MRRVNLIPRSVLFAVLLSSDLQNVANRILCVGHCGFILLLVDYEVQLLQRSRYSWAKAEFSFRKYTEWIHSEEKCDLRLRRYLSVSNCTNLWNHLKLGHVLGNSVGKLHSLVTSKWDHQAIWSSILSWLRTFWWRISRTSTTTSSVKW